MRSKDIRLEDVETILLPLGSKPMEAKFLISFSVDLSQLQNSTCESSDVAILLITYCGVDWNYIIPQLFFKKSVEDILGGTTALQIPCFPPHKFLMDYVPEIKKFVAEKVCNSLLLSCEVVILVLIKAIFILDKFISPKFRKKKKFFSNADCFAKW